MPLFATEKISFFRMSAAGILPSKSRAENFGASTPAEISKTASAAEARSMEQTSSIMLRLSGETPPGRSQPSGRVTTNRLSRPVKSPQTRFLAPRTRIVPFGAIFARGLAATISLMTTLSGVSWKASGVLWT